MLSAETWKNVSLIDSQCVDKAKANPDKHTVKCALNLRGRRLRHPDGGGQVPQVRRRREQEGGWPRFSATKKTDSLRATVEGTVSGDEIKVTSLKLD